MPEDRITPDSIVTWSEEPVATEVDREVVLMNLARGRCYGLGEPGSDIWRRLREPIRVRDLCAALREEYDADAGLLASDVLSLLESMRDEGLVRIVA